MQPLGMNGNSPKAPKRLTENKRLTLSALHIVDPEMVLFRVDPDDQVTPSGVILPDRDRPGLYTTEPATAKERAFPDRTAVILKVGDEVKGWKVGDRALLCGPAIPIPVLGEDAPLGLLNYKDLYIRVGEAN